MLQRTSRKVFFDKLYYVFHCVDVCAPINEQLIVPQICFFGKIRSSVLAFVKLWTAIIKFETRAASRGASPAQAHSEHGQRGRYYDNARMESFWATLKREKLYQIGTTKLPRDTVKSVVFRYIRYYDLRRISSVTGGLPPLAYRARYATTAAGEIINTLTNSYTSALNFY